jgi:hypothetical protein
MNATPKILAQGQVASSKAAIYTVPAATRTIVRHISFAHVANGTQSVVLYAKKAGGTSRVISRVTLELNEFGHEDDIITLDAEDQLQSETTNPVSVDFTVMGVEIK